LVGQLGLDKSGQIVEGGTLAQAEQVRKFYLLNEILSIDF